MSHPRLPRRRAIDPLFEIKIDPPKRGSRQSAKGVYAQVRAAILDGRLAAGAKLPPTRKAGVFFGISRNTVSEVYRRLEHAGLVLTRHGSGSYIAQAVQSPLHTRLPREVQPVRHRVNKFWLRTDIWEAMNFWRDPAAPSPPRHKTPQTDFRPAMLDSALFPFDLFRRVSATQLRGLERRPTSYRSHQGNQGNYSLREAVARHIAMTRAVVCGPAEIVVTSGAQQAFDLLARILVTPNETVVAVEDPGYPPLRVSFAAAGARLVPVGIDAEGLMVDRLPDNVGIIYVTPSHQFPLGVTMSPRRRNALIEYARKHAAVIIEDDYDGEFRYEGGPVEALRSAHSSDVVFYVGTFSKSMLPALRLGFIVAPDWAMRTLIAAKNCLDWHCSTPIQRAVAGFISGGHLARHVRKMRNTYQQRREQILKYLREECGDWLDPIPSLYGMHITAIAQTPVNLEWIAIALRRQNVRMHTLARFYLGPQTRRGLIFGFGTADPTQIRRGLSLLRKAASTVPTGRLNRVSGRLKRQKIHFSASNADS